MATSHIILRPDGKVYALKASDLEQFQVSDDIPELDEYADELQSIQSLAFKVDENGNPNPHGTSCGFLIALYKAVHEDKPTPDEKMAYINLDFNMNVLGDD